MHSDSIASRFWASLREEGDCWLWARTKLEPNGRARIRPLGDKGPRYLVYRFAWELVYGPIPDGLIVCHSCDVGHCCNPAHLFLGTYKDNMEDAARKGRMPRGDKNGSRLHPERIRRGENHPARIHNNSYYRRGENHPSRSRDYFARGSAHHNAKVTEDAVREMRQLRTLGTTLETLAQRFGITAVTVSKIVRHEAWKHVP